VAVPIELRGSNAAKTIAFKNVLDGLNAFETSSDVNVSGEQTADPQDSTAKNNGASAGSNRSSAGKNGALAGKSVPSPTPGPQPHGAPQQDAPQIPLLTPQIPLLTSQQLAQLGPAATAAATPARPKQAVETQQDAPQSTEPAEPGHADASLAENARLGASVQTPRATASSAPAKSSAIEAEMIAEPAPAANAVSTSKDGPDMTPAVTSSEAKPEARTRLETATEAGSEPPKVQTPGEGRSAIPSRSASSSAIAPSQPKPTPVASPQVTAAPSPHRIAANPPAANRWRPVAAVTPQPPRTSAAGSVSAPLVEPEVTPTESSTTVPVPAPNEPVSKAAAAHVLPQQRPQTIPATTPSQPAVARAQTAEPAAPATAPPLPVQTAPAPAATTRAATPIAPPPSTSPNPKDSSSPSIASPDSGGTQNQSDAPQRPANSIDSAADPFVTHLAAAPAPAVTHLAAAPAPVAESAASTYERPAPETPESNVAAQSEAIEGAAAAKSQTPVSPQAENFAFAVRMIAPDDAVLTEALPAVSAAQPQMSQTKPSVTQPSPAQAPQQPGQVETSSNSKIETQSPAPDTEKTDARDSKAAVPQSSQTQETVARWSDVSAAPLPSEINSALPSSGLAEVAHDSTALAPQETHLMAPELPRTSASTDILLHLTGDDQSSAAIRVADRAGSVNVSVHAADPVLRESLRSNIEQLSTQLTGQGWKAEVLKPAVIAAQSESQQDSHSGGQRSSQQQQSFGGDRQPQRDRRAQAGYWQQELEQQISGGDAQTGGKG
jgi:hypothetical protein